MKALKRRSSILVLVLALLGGLHCSVDPVAGGTETGNPEVAMCASFIFDALSDTASWSVVGYVPGGLDHLDSTTIVSGGAYRHPGGSLAKQRTERTDTIIGEYHYVTYTTYVDDTVLISDTSYSWDTTFVDTSVVDTFTTYDTIPVVEEGDTTFIVRAFVHAESTLVLDTLYSIDTIMRTDTVFLLDTIVIHDTIPATSSISSRDTFPTLVVDSPINSYYARGDTADVASSPSASLRLEFMDTAAAYIVFNEYTSGLSDTIPVASENVSRVSTEAIGMLTKSLLTADGARIEESYADLDGDGVLFGRFSQRILYEHAYSRNADSLYAGVDFGPGYDNSFATPRNNSIRFLLRRLSLPGATIETTYRCSTRTASGDTVKLRTCEARTDSSLEIYTHFYTLIRGGDADIGNDDRLAAWHGNVIYNRGDIERIDLTVTLDSPTRRAEMPGYGTVRAVVWMRDKSVGVMDSAVVDVEAGTLSGEYVRNGETYPFVETRE